MHNYTTQTVTTMTSLPADDVTNSSGVWEEEGLGDEYDSAKFIIPVIFALIFLCGVVGNGLLIAIVLRNKEMRNTPNILILSLALGDLVLITISVPFTAPIYTLPSWPFGLTICKINEFLQTTSLGVSVFTLVALSADRYMAISYPLWQRQFISTRRTLIIAGVIWLVAILLAVPDALTAHVNNWQACDTGLEGDIAETYAKYRALLRFIIYFALPLTIIATFYVLMSHKLFASSRGITASQSLVMPASRRMTGSASTRSAVAMETANGSAARMQRSASTAPGLESRRRVAITVLVFVAMFVTCWLPRHTYLLWFYFDEHGEFNMGWYVTKVIGFCLMFLNSCINPVALYAVSAQFRSHFRRYLCYACMRGQDLQRARSYHSRYGNHGPPSQAPTSTYAMSTVRRPEESIALYSCPVVQRTPAERKNSDMLTERWGHTRVSRLSSSSRSSVLPDDVTIT